MRGLFSRLVLIVIIVGIGLGYWRWRQDRVKESSPPTVGNNLAADQLDISLNKEGSTENNKDEPTATLTSAAGSVEIRTSSQASVVSYSLTALLPRLETGSYFAWVENEKVGDLINLGKFLEEKGGLMLTFQTKGTVKGYDTLMITRELLDDAKPEQILIRGKLPEGR